MKTYRRLAGLLEWRERTLVSKSDTWESHVDKLIRELMDYAPSGSGIDSGTKLLDPTFKSGKVIAIKLQADYHHMNEAGYYDGWTEHVVTIRPSLADDFTLSISGRDRNQIKEYLHDVYSTWLDEEAKV